MTQVAFSFKNTDTGHAFNQILDIHTRINNIRNSVANNVLLNFNLNINEFDIVEAGQQESENAIQINECDNSMIKNKYSNNIKYISFYIRPTERFYISEQSVYRFKHSICGMDFNQNIDTCTSSINLRNIISNSVLNNFGLDQSQYDIVSVGQSSSERGIPINEYTPTVFEKESTFYIRPREGVYVVRIKNIINGEIFIQHFDSFMTIRNLRNIIQSNVLQKFGLTNDQFYIAESGHQSLENSDIIDENNDNIIGQNRIFCIKPKEMEAECPVCYENFNFFHMTCNFSCSHRMCNGCYRNWSTTCPECRSS